MVIYGGVLQKLSVLSLKEALRVGEDYNHRISIVSYMADRNVGSSYVVMFDDVTKDEFWARGPTYEQVLDVVAHVGTGSALIACEQGISRSSGMACCVWAASGAFAGNPAEIFRQLSLSVKASWDAGHRASLEVRPNARLILYADRLGSFGGSLIREYLRLYPSMHPTAQSFFDAVGQNPGG